MTPEQFDSHLRREIGGGWLHMDQVLTVMRETCGVGFTHCLTDAGRDAVWAKLRERRMMTIAPGVLFVPRQRPPRRSGERGPNRIVGSDRQKLRRTQFVRPAGASNSNHVGDT